MESNSKLREMDRYFFATFLLVFTVFYVMLAGLAMGVRIAGILLLIYLAGVVVGLAWLRARRTRSLDAGLTLARRLGLPAALSMLGAWLVMLSTWPWGLLDPIRRPWMALGRMSRFTVHTRTMPFAGEEMLTTEPRWDYLLHYFGLKLPLPVLLLVVAGVVLMVMALRRPDGLDGISRAKRNVVLVIGAAILAPPAYAIVVRSVVYDGLRHFLFLVPPLIVMAAVTAVVLPRAITRSRNIVVSVLALALTMGETSPSSMSDINCCRAR